MVTHKTILVAYKTFSSGEPKEEKDVEGLNCGETKDIKAKEHMPPAAADVDIIQEQSVSITHDSSGDTQDNSDEPKEPPDEYDRSLPCSKTSQTFSDFIESVIETCVAFCDVKDGRSVDGDIQDRSGDT